MSTNPVDALLAGIETASWEGVDVFAHDVSLDATVPGWRFVLEGADAVRAQLAHWFCDPSVTIDLRRVPPPGGELVEIFFHWDEESGRHWANQVHVLDVRDGRITQDRMWCGGRWDERAAAEMQLLQLAG